MEVARSVGFSHDDIISREANHHTVFSALQYLITSGLRRYGYVRTDIAEEECLLKESDKDKTFVRYEPKTGPDLAIEGVFLFVHHKEFQEFRENFERGMEARQQAREAEEGA